MNALESLVVVVDGEPLASTETIAAGIGQRHHSVIQLVRKHQAALECLGSLAFQMRVKRADGRGGEPTVYAMLNERQAALLISLMRNTEKAVEFKVALIKEFYRMSDALNARTRNLWQQLQAVLARDAESLVRASFGSHLMLTRKRELPGFGRDRAEFSRPLVLH